jgi:ribosomal protein S18 acetylase RimI-like enzyme
VLEHARGLTADVMRAISDLEQRVLVADGGRLKLEWSVLRGRTGERVEDLLWWEPDQLCGFLGIYSFGGPVELAGMVAPDARRRGIGSQLLDTALAVCRSQGHPEALLVVPRGSAGGRALALARGGRLHHSEHALRLDRPPSSPAVVQELVTRPAGDGDRPELARLRQDGFGSPVGLGDVEIDPARGQTLLIEHAGRPVGTMRTSREGDQADIYGFVIDSALRGRGLGRNALAQVCDQLLRDGAQRIGLEVEVGNEHALGLYTSLGFAPVTTEDYYLITTG